MASSWAVVLVHGVGDTEPGATLDALLGKALEKPQVGVQPVLAETAAPEIRRLAETKPELPKPHDPLDPPPAAEESWRGPEGRFPMYVRTFANSAPHEPERVVFAEVFWADLSRAGDSRFQVLLRTMALIFDLRHVADVASAEHKTVLAWALRRVLFAVSWLLCGPIAAVTAYVAAILAAYHAAISIEHFAGAWGVVGVCLAAIGIAGVMFWRARASPPPSGRRTAIVAGVTAVLLVLLAVAAHCLGWQPNGEWGMAAFAVAAMIAMLLFHDARKRSEQRPDGAWLLFAACAAFVAFISLMVAGPRLAGCEDFPWSWGPGASLALSLRLGPHEIEHAAATHAAVLLGLGYWVFVLLAFFAVVAFVLWAVGRFTYCISRSKGGAALDAALGASYLQVTFWVILGTAIGTFAVGRLPGLDKSGAFEWVVLGFMLKLFVVVVIGGCAFLVVVWRKVQVRVCKAHTARQVARLLVNWFVMRALHILTVVSVAIFASVFATRSDLLDRYFGDFKDDALELSGVLAAVTAAPFVLKGMRAILHILVDITNHFYRARIRLWRVLPGKDKLHAGEFETQQRIEARMRRVLQEVLAPGDVTHLTVVAHSQGTMIAIDVLWLTWTRRLLENVQVRLVTMGSPFTHLYQHYFPARYPPLFASHDAWGVGLAATLKAWINIYRIDDYIGTWVDGRDGFPENHPTPTPGGHINYWSDPEALEIMAPYLPQGLAVRSTGRGTPPAAT
jgi:hypothetical protein